jgi:hypothetical protein
VPTKSVKVGAKELAMRQALQATDICGGITSRGNICMNRAGKGTDHLGTGPCSIHDNAARIINRAIGARYKDGVAPSALELYLDMVEDPEIKSLDQEIALLRTRLNDMQMMITEIRDRSNVMEPDPNNPGGLRSTGRRALLPQAFGEKYDPAGTADHKAIMALTRDTAKVAESISKLIDRKHKIEEGKLVTYRQVQEVLAQVIYVIKKNCDGCKSLPRMAEDFATIDISKFEPR